MEREAESRDIRRLCRAALDTATRNILSRTSGRGYTLAGCPPARSWFDVSLAQPETPISSTDSAQQCLRDKKTTSNFYVTGRYNLLIFHCPLDG